jgi:hypothetical protein
MDGRNEKKEMRKEGREKGKTDERKEGRKDIKEERKEERKKAWTTPSLSCQGKTEMSVQHGRVQQELSVQQERVQ